MSHLNGKISMADPIYNKKYEEELRKLGWCIPCQGYGQNWEDGYSCKGCNGTGETIKK